MIRYAHVPPGEVAVGSVVSYHGSLTGCYGEYRVTAVGHVPGPAGRVYYTMVSITDGTRLYLVHRRSVQAI